MAGHFRRTKTIELITHNYTWPKLKAFVTNYILTCNQCNCCKPNRHKPYGLLQPLPIPSGPWKSISMDFIVSLPKSNNHDAILVIVDCLTKAAHFIPTTNQINTFNTAKLFLNNIYKLHGLPNDIISDCGSIFTSSMWTELMKLLNIKLNLSTAFCHDHRISMYKLLMHNTIIYNVIYILIISDSLLLNNFAYVFVSLI